MSHHCTDMRFDSFLTGGFTTMAVMNPPEKKLEKRTSVHWYISLEGGTVCSNRFYADISNQRQMQQDKSCLKSFL